MPANRTFRCNVRNFFVTYPQSGTLTKQEVLAFFQNKFGARIRFITIAKEAHQDGTPHIHVNLGLTNKYDCSNARAFDIGNYHPNIQPTRNVHDAEDYLRKDDEPLTVGDIPVANTPATQTDWAEVLLYPESYDPTNIQVITNSNNQDEFLTNALAAEPLVVIKSFSNFQSFATWKYRATTEPYSSGYELGDYRIDALTECGFMDWYSESFCAPRPERPKSLVLVGPTRCGKTELVRSLGHHMYFNGHVNFRNDWDDSAGYIIFDDFEFDFLPNKKCFFGAQKSFVITDKYSAKRSVNWGKPSIYLTNNPFTFPQDAFYSEENMVVINLHNYFLNKPYKKLY